METVEVLKADLSAVVEFYVIEFGVDLEGGRDFSAWEVAEIGEFFFGELEGF